MPRRCNYGGFGTENFGLEVFCRDSFETDSRYDTTKQGLLREYVTKS